MTFSELCSKINRELHALEAFYDDPMTQAYGAYDCAPLVEKGAQRRIRALLADAGMTPTEFLQEVERRTCSRIAARFDNPLLGAAQLSDIPYQAGYAYACGYHD